MFFILDFEKFFLQELSEALSWYDNFAFLTEGVFMVSLRQLFESNDYQILNLIHFIRNSNFELTCFGYRSIDHGYKNNSGAGCARRAHRQSALIPHFHHHHNHHHQVLVALVGLIGNVLSFIILSTQVVNSKLIFIHVIVLSTRVVNSTQN